MPLVVRYSINSLYDLALFRTNYCCMYLIYLINVTVCTLVSVVEVSEIREVAGDISVGAQRHYGNVLIEGIEFGLVVNPILRGIKSNLFYARGGAYMPT